MNEIPVYAVNEVGLQEIKEFLTKRLKGADYFTEEMLKAWAAEAEFQLSEGNAPTIELLHTESVSGHTEEYCISQKGLDIDHFVVIDDEEDYNNT